MNSFIYRPERRKIPFNVMSSVVLFRQPGPASCFRSEDAALINKLWQLHSKWEEPEQQKLCSLDQKDIGLCFTVKYLCNQLCCHAMGSFSLPFIFNWSITEPSHDSRIIGSSNSPEQLFPSIENAAVTSTFGADTSFICFVFYRKFMSICICRRLTKGNWRYKEDK